jgi:hypothetical protein
LNGIQRQVELMDVDDSVEQRLVGVDLNGRLLAVKFAALTFQVVEPGIGPCVVQLGRDARRSSWSATRMRVVAALSRALTVN